MCGGGECVDIKCIAAKWLGARFGRVQNEPHYLKIKPLIFAEELLDVSQQDIPSTSLIDYKIWCINGKPQYVFTVHDRTKTTMKINLYNTNWEEHNELLVYGGGLLKERSLPRPKNLDRMLDIARILSEGFPQVRIDLYNLCGKIYFGEMTFSSNGGRMKYFSEKLLKELGSKISYND